MGYSFEYIDIILLAMIAGFIFLRLRGILGKRTGFEGKSTSQFENVINNVQVKNTNIENGEFDKNAQKDFLKGAEIAYESILTSFASGDLIKLKALLSPNMFSNFSDAIKARNKENIN